MVKFFWWLLPFAGLFVILSYGTKLRSSNPIAEIRVKRLCLGISIAWAAAALGTHFAVPIVFHLVSAPEIPRLWLHLFGISVWGIFFAITYISCFGLTLIIFKLARSRVPKSALAALALQPTALVLVLMTVGGHRSVSSLGP